MIKIVGRRISSSAKSGVRRLVMLINDTYDRHNEGFVVHWVEFLLTFDLNTSLLFALNTKCGSPPERLAVGRLESGPE